MTLLVVLIAIGLQRYLTWGEAVSRTAWLSGYLSRMQSMLQRTPLWSNVVGLIVVMLPILIVVALVQWLLKGWFFSILRFIFDLSILWYCLDAFPLQRKLSGYFKSLIHEDQVNLQQQGSKFIRAEKKKSHLASVTSLARAITAEIFSRAEENLFGILFWYVVLGPIGAVIYYLIVSIRDLAARTNSLFVELLIPANQLFGILDWIPVRLLAMSYALVGHFVSGFNYCRKNFLAGIQQTTDFAVNAGFAALNMEHIDVIHADAEENQAALGLVDRALFLWVVFIAIFTLGGWL